MTYLEWIEQNFDRDRDSALITGGTSGIGLAYVNLLAKAGCHCIVVSNEPERFAEVQASIKQRYGARVDFIDCDLADYAQVIGLGPMIRSQRIAILINNAGFGLKGNFTDLTSSAYRDVVAVNALAPTVISHLVLPQMIERNGGIHLSVASINVASPMAKNAVYTATKFYIWAYALALYEENRHTGIRFQIMLPGTTDTPFHAKQGVKVASMTMAPDVVAQRSLDAIDQLIHIPNRIDRWIYPLGSRLPIGIRMKIASMLLKKRLGV